MSVRPFTLTVAVGLESAEGVAALSFGLFVGWETLFGDPQDRAGAIGVTVIALLSGAGMLAVARGLLRAQRWSRSPAVLTQLLALFIAWNLVQSDQLLYGLPLAACAIAAAILLLSRPTTGALYDS